MLIQQESSTITNRMQFKSTQVELQGVVNAFPPLRGRLCSLDVIRKPRTPKLFLECYCMARKSQSGVSLSHTAVLCLVLCLAWRKSLTREPHSPFSTSLQTFCVGARAYLHTSKYGQYWSLQKHVCVPKKIHIKIRCIKYSWQAFIKPWDGFCRPL